jgi:hypothetical protein
MADGSASSRAEVRRRSVRGLLAEISDAVVSVFSRRMVHLRNAIDKCEPGPDLLGLPGIVRTRARHPLRDLRVAFAWVGDQRGRGVALPGLQDRSYAFLRRREALRGMKAQWCGRFCC